MKIIHLQHFHQVILIQLFFHHSNLTACTMKMKYSSGFINIYEGVRTKLDK